MTALHVDVITVFPRYLDPLRESLLGKATDRGLVRLDVHDLRAWTTDVHRTVDDSPYGGGPGMVMRPEPWAAALRDLLPIPAAERGERGEVPAADDRRPTVIIPTPAGRSFDQSMARDFAGRGRLVFLCGRYEGIDARIPSWTERYARVEEVSLGDYVLSGGEAAVIVMVEAVTRLIPGFMGNRESAEQDSFSSGLLDWPSYTRPATWQGMAVPSVLLSGDHARVARWRRDEALRRTARLRPEILTREVLETLNEDDLRTLERAGLRVPPDLLAH